ncbi:electron transfer flavoprotein subunit beta [Nocardioides aquiterrae]|uniref:electron transfer flavoprotein subunit beta/FixA family protein n=1 Tax=Nocardioides aquiterrae TaxID=203799 RepID=UPI0031D53961
MTQALEVSAYLEFTADGTAVDEAFVTTSLNEADQNAVEEALALVEAAGDGEVVVVSAGGDEAEEALRAGLTMGAHRAVRVDVASVLLADTRTLAAALGQAVAAEQPDLVLTGVQASDTGSQSAAPALAAVWGVPAVSVARSLALGGRTLTARREFEGGVSDEVEVDLPAVVSVQVGANEPRYGTFKDKMRAKKAEIPVLTPVDLPAARVVLTQMSADHAGGRTVQMVQGGPAEVAARILTIVREVQ